LAFILRIFPEGAETSFRLGFLSAAEEEPDDEGGEPYRTEDAEPDDDGKQGLRDTGESQDSGPGDFTDFPSNNPGLTLFN
jgi:hypothetical protein